MLTCCNYESKEYGFNTWLVENFFMKRKFLLNILKSIHSFPVLNPHPLDPNLLQAPLHHLGACLVVVKSVLYCFSR